MSTIRKQFGDFCIGFRIDNSSVVFVSYTQADKKKQRLNFFCYTYYPRRSMAYSGIYVPDGVQQSNPAFIPFFDKWYGYNGKCLTTKKLGEIQEDIWALKQSGAPFVEATDGDTEMNQNPRNAKGLLMTKPHKAYRIKWDTDGATYKECGLPRSVIVPYYMDEDDVADWLSDTYGFCHDGFCTNFCTEDNCEK